MALVVTTQSKPEWCRQAWLHRFLERVVLPPCEIRGIDHAGAAQANVGSRMMALGRGIKPGTPDIFVWQRRFPGMAPITVAIEVKHNSRASDAQMATARSLRECGVHVAGECHRPLEVLAELRIAGIALHGNAASLALEYEARMHAGLRELAERKPRAAAKPRTLKPTAGRVARFERARARTLV